MLFATFLNGVEVLSHSAPVNMIRCVCPGAQVKNFGRRGRTKYTHLVDQDTTQFDDPLAPSEAVARKLVSRMATEQLGEKPKTYRT